MTEQERNNAIRGEEDTTNIRRVGAKDRKKRIQMTGALFPDEPMNEAEAGDASPPPAAQPAPSEQPRTVDEVAEVEARPAQQRPVAKPKRRSSNAFLYNLIALIFALATIVALVYFVFLWNNYNSPLNPFAPPTPMPNYIIVTPSS